MMEERIDKNNRGGVQQFLSSEVASDIYDASAFMDKARHMSLQFEDKYKLNDDPNSISKAPSIWEYREMLNSMYYDMWIINDYLCGVNDILEKLLDVPIYNPEAEGGAV